jgi:hypothetical protein
VKTRRPTYPFEPRSNAYLEAGQFWGVPLSDGRFACGRVVAVPREPDGMLPVNTRSFLAGLMDWVGDGPPDAEAIAGSKLVRQGMAHVKTIRENGRFVLGYRDLGLDGITGLRELSHYAGGTVYLYAGARRLRPATGDEIASLGIRSTWGFKVVSVVAEALFVRPG